MIFSVIQCKLIKNSSILPFLHKYMMKTLLPLRPGLSGGKRFGVGMLGGTGFKSQQGPKKVTYQSKYMETLSKSNKFAA